jgi:hypothetical protein
VIAEALTFVVGEVNRYLNARLGPVTPDRVVLGNIARLADNDGNAGNNASNGVAMLSLVNLEEDKVSRNPENFRRIGDELVYRNPAVRLNLFGLFSAHTTAYSTALEILSLIIQCFQAQRTFEPAVNPHLDPRIEQLTLDLFTLNFEQVNHLWSTLGGKYYPSVLYKIRLVAIEDTTPYAGGELIQEISLNGKTLNPNP